MGGGGGGVGVGVGVGGGVVVVVAVAGYGDSLLLTGGLGEKMTFQQRNWNK